jgi:hypothetical protein
MGSDFMDDFSFLGSVINQRPPAEAGGMGLAPGRNPGPPCCWWPLIYKPYISWSSTKQLVFFEMATLVGESQWQAIWLVFMFDGISMGKHAVPA